MYTLVDGLREAETDADVNVSSSASETAQNVSSATVTSNAESKVQSTSQGMYVHCNHVHTIWFTTNFKSTQDCLFQVFEIV